MKSMLRIAAGFALAACFAVLAACGAVQLKPVSIPVIPPQQLARDVCPIVKADLDILTSAAGLALLTPAQQQAVAQSIEPKFSAACSAAAAVDLTNLQAFNETAFPALISIVSATPAIPNQPAVLLGLELAQPILNQVVADAIAAPKPADAAIAPSAPATK